MRLKLATTLSAITAATAVAFTGNPAAAVVSNDVVAQILAKMPEVQEADLRADIQDYATSENISFDAAAQRTLDDINSHDPDPGTTIIKDVALHLGTYADIFYTDASTLGLNHGHVGIYSGGNEVVQSNYGQGVHRGAATSTKVRAGTVAQVRVAKAESREPAVKWALGQVGKPYDMDFASNKGNGEEGKFNCSELVWRAFVHQGVDLDGDGGPGVYPRDIRDDNNVTTVAKY